MEKWMTIRKGALRRTPPKGSGSELERGEKYYTPRGKQRQRGSSTSRKWEDEELGSSEIYELTKNEERTPTGKEERQIAKRKRTSEETTPREGTRSKREMREEELRIHTMMEKIIYITGIKLTTTEEDIKNGIRDVVGIEKEDVQIKSIKEGKYKEKTAVVELPKQAAKALIQEGTIKMGWSFTKSAMISFSDATLIIFKTNPRTFNHNAKILQKSLDPNGFS
ncbi:unnamed protein product [Phyllotreta striolata]|uniref:Uncharacterized protein n=1 Tax=Phyllotreta striolata TaxID=444603 RepID=A0A9N9XRL4_PHYSR|nr:unnamed protein product [Phyllotreta striolata]